MANDINMWNDLEHMDKRTSEYRILSQCYYCKYIEYDDEAADKWKEVYEHTFKKWGNYY